MLKQLHSAGQLPHLPPAYTRRNTAKFKELIHRPRWLLPEPPSPDERLIRLTTDTSTHQPRCANGPVASQSCASLCCWCPTIRINRKLLAKQSPSLLLWKARPPRIPAHQLGGYSNSFCSTSFTGATSTRMCSSSCSAQVYKLRSAATSATQPPLLLICSCYCQG